MKHTLHSFVVWLLCICFSWMAAAQSPQRLEVDFSKPGAAIQPTMWGIFFEDINFAADGGIYAELVKNRSFEFFTPLMGWKEQKQGDATGSILILNRGEKNPENPRFARIGVQAEKGAFGFQNEGFRGMGIRKDIQYHFSVWARVVEGNANLRLEFVNAKDEKIGEAKLALAGEEWKKYTVSFPATATDPKAQLKIWFEGKGILDVDMISLFPSDTWKNRPGGLRADLVQLLADLKPGFLRFPGGCIVEGRDLSNRYQWKKTVGKVEDRELIVNRWNMEFRHRPAPDYFQTFGLGFFEYFQLAEDIGAEPLPILNCGMACQFNTSEVVPVEQLDPFVQDALDLIEFANGDVTTTWGRLRAEMGHPEPFDLKMMGVGNEQWGPQYVDRYKVFVKAIKSRYPTMQLIASVGPFSDGDLFNYLFPQMKALKADFVDEHYYRPPDWFLKNAARYDQYDRNGPKIFAGEYAAHSKAVGGNENRNDWRSAVSEAAFMTGLERNADIVHMASYAPLFAHAEGWQWSPDLIWFDNLRSYGTPNYYVQKLFSNNKGSHVLPVLSGKQNVSGQNSLYASAVWDQATKEIIVKIVNTSEKGQATEVALNGAAKLSPKGSITTLRSESTETMNSFEDPAKIVPVEQPLAVKGKSVKLVLPPHSFTVLRVKALK